MELCRVYDTDLAHGRRVNVAKRGIARIVKMGIPRGR